MALDLFHAEAVTDGEPAGLITTGGTGSILHAVLAYREQAAARGVTRPNFVKPETGHPAFDKACHLFGIELRVAPIDPAATTVDVAAMADLIDDQTIAIMGSACNYPYGTIDPIPALGDLALERGVGLHVDGCLGGFILPFGEELGLADIPLFDFRVPGVTRISADTHKYGYAFKGSSTLLFRDKALRNGQYFFVSGWTGGKYMSPGIEGSRSGGLIAATWAAMVQLGRDGYRRYAEAIFATAAEMMAAVRSHPELRIMGSPTFCFSFTSDEFDIYHVNDLMRERGVGASTASSTPTPSTWPSPARRPSRAWPTSSPPTSPTRSPSPASARTRRRSRPPSTAAWPAGSPTRRTSSSAA